MKTKLMQLPRSVLVGRDAIDEIAEVLRGLGLSGRALVVADSTTIDVAGNRATEVLNPFFKTTSEIITGASIEEVRRMERCIEDSDSNFVVAVGGGRVIDVSKLAAKNRGVHFVSVPTAAAHDGIASSRASIKEDGNTVSKGANPPIAIIADTGVIAGAPYRLLASGCADIIAKYTSVLDWELAYEKKKADEYSEYASALSRMSAKIIMDSAETIKSGGEESVRKVVKALISCGVAMSIAGSSRPASGSEHKFSHALDMIASNPGLHGEQCGVGTIMMMYLHGGDWRRIRDALISIGAPTTAEEIGITDDLIIDALVKAREIRPQRYTILEEKMLSKKQAEILACETGVISG